MANEKGKMLKIGLTLGIIGGASALLIGLTNLVTAPVISANAENEVMEGLQDVYPSLSAYTENDIDSSDYTYLVSYYVAYSDTAKTKEIGYIYETDGKNSYGEVSLLVGVTDSGLGQIYVLTNTETYGTTLEDNYITKYNDGDITINDVTCGATYGAKLVKAECEEALTHYQTVKGE